MIAQSFIRVEFNRRILLKNVMKIQEKLLVPHEFPARDRIELNAHVLRNHARSVIWGEESL
ncbi:hypothetical protein BSQ33_12060 [Vibrio gazogenes]|uniref:Uncharacterized protein n=1 Tax=Vibrio gazogenes TaxID=687 RepID=A0A1Z2SGR7_VIBGA|nr:hypothetical protein BSQ33_12060 [Vibrio gazogenes]